METGYFDTDDLVKCYSPPNLHSVMPGNQVMLRSGGPLMIVREVGADGLAVCDWESQGKRETHAFDLRCLTCYGAK